MPDMPIPSALTAANTLDPNLLDNAKANAAKLVKGLKGGYTPDEEPAHIYQAGGAQ